MLEILAFIFRDFWTLVGVLCLITVIGTSIAMPFAAYKGADIINIKHKK